MLLSYLSSAIEMIRDFASQYQEVYDGITIVLKIIGIAYLCEFAIQVLRDAGEGAIASKVELGGADYSRHYAASFDIFYAENPLHFIGEQDNIQKKEAAHGCAAYAVYFSPCCWPFFPGNMSGRKRRAKRLAKGRSNLFRKASILFWVNWIWAGSRDFMNKIQGPLAARVWKKPWRISQKTG